MDLKNHYGKKYLPRPIGTTGVKFPDEIRGLVEMLAENTHEVWAKGRMDEGWTYGPVRKDARKQHPCMVPYSELPDSEKEYDRNTSMETFRLIISRGFVIKNRNIQSEMVCEHGSICWEQRGAFDQF